MALEDGLLRFLRQTETAFQQFLGESVLPLLDSIQGLGKDLQAVATSYIDGPALADGLRQTERTIPELSLELTTSGQTIIKPIAAPLLQFEQNYQRFMKTRFDPLFGAARDQQIKDLAVGPAGVEISPSERELNRNLALSGLITLVALVTKGLHPLFQLVACVPLAGYLAWPVFKKAYQSLVQERRLTLSVLGAVNLTALWLGGYFVLGGIIFILTFLAQKLSHITEDRSHDRLVNIFGQQPRHIWVLQEGVEIEIPFEQLQAGDALVISAGQMVPADGVIIQGYATIDQHRLTGESQPIEKGIGDRVLAATVVLVGSVHVRVEKAGQDTIAAQIGEMLNKTASYQLAIETNAQQLAEASVTPTLIAAGLAWGTVGYEGMVAITNTIFGLNLRISGPIALLSYLNVAARNGILVKDGRSLELLKGIDTVIFDKTGTLTLEQPHVTQIHAFDGLSSDAVLTHAAAIEQRQTHPIARAILAAARERGLPLPDMTDARYEVGYGIQAWIDGRLICVGSDRFMALEEIPLPPAIPVLQADCHAQGYSLILVALDRELVGAIALEPTIRPEVKAIIAELRERNLNFYIVSGDQDQPTRKLAHELGIEHYFANTLPENKAKWVEQLQQEGHAVCFVGDGINDSIALKKANVSISLRGATTVATDTAQIVLMDATLRQLPLLFKLAQEMDDNLKTNYILAIVPGLGIWAGVFFFRLGILGAALLFEVSLWAGIGNALRPLLTHRQEEAQPAHEDTQRTSAVPAASRPPLAIG